MGNLNSKVPSGPVESKWTDFKFNLKLVNPANKRKYDIIVVGTGLAGASAAASLGELGYNVKAFCFHDSPRPARIASPHRAVLTPQRIIRMTATQSSDCFMILLKAATSVHAKQMFTGWLK